MLKVVWVGLGAFVGGFATGYFTRGAIDDLREKLDNRAEYEMRRKLSVLQEKICDLLRKDQPGAMWGDIYIWLNTRLTNDDIEVLQELEQREPGRVEHWITETLVASGFYKHTKGPWAFSEPSAPS